MSKKTDIFLAFLGGAVTGAAIGILFAPEKGSSTRDRLSFQLDRYRDKLGDIVDQLMSGENLPPSEAREEGEKIINSAKTKAEELLGDVESLINEIKNKSQKFEE